MKRAIIIFALAAIVALPFVLRPKRPALAQADDTVVIVTPHNEAIRHEFALGFTEWYKAKTGRTIYVDWRVLGGTSEIARYLEGEYVASFENYWSNKLGKPWDSTVQGSFQNARLPADASAEAKEARATFLKSDVGCGIDIFFGGGALDFDGQAFSGRMIPSDVGKNHPDWFSDAIVPQFNSGNPYRDPQLRWVGTVISLYGIIYNRDGLAHLKITKEPDQWTDLADPRFVGEVALCDPTKSGSIAMAFENVIQQQMQRRLKILSGAASGADSGKPSARTNQAVREGWNDGLRLIQLIGANARYFTDTSQKPPIDVADGDCAAGMCIDFYGNQQREAILRRGDSQRLGFAAPVGGTAFSVDPIGLMRGAPHIAAAQAFIEYVLSMEGQKLWNFKPGTPGGPKDFALRRLPVRKDFYEHKEWLPFRSDPSADPYVLGDAFVYHPEWTGRLFREMAFIIRVMCQDTHDELVDAWRAIIVAPEPARSRALAVLQDIPFVGYERAGTDVKNALSSRDQVNEVRFANALAARFRTQYAKAEAIAKGQESP